jgi:D-alanyl-D-alanine dipeptidase
MMEEEGFRQYEQEWWHYSFSVPGALVAFDLEIR